tara:strand:- start:142 stop:324 length:183 start_codon:yes stop_codon:yes gene_type:complete
MLNITWLPIASDNTLQDVEHLSGADTAGNTLAAGLILSKGNKEPGHINHAGIFISNEHAS